MRSKRLLIVGNFLSRFQNRAVCEDLTEHLRDSGWSVIATSDQRNRVLRLTDMLTTIWARQRDYDVAQVDVFSGRAFLWAELACQLLHRLKKPFILTLHGGNLPAFARGQPQRVQHLLRSAYAVTAPSRYMQSSMAPYRADIQVIPNPLDLSLYPTRARTDVQPRLVWLRAISPEYNPLMALETVRLLRTDFPDMQLALVGPIHDTNLHGQLARFIAEHGLEQRVRLVGGVPRQQVPQWLDQADILLNTTRIDNTPVSVMEALACGLCVVSTNVGGIPYLLTHEENALLVENDDSQAMAAAVRRCLREPGLAAMLSSCGRQMAQTLDWSFILPQWNRILNDAIAANSSRASRRHH